MLETLRSFAWQGMSAFLQGWLGLCYPAPLQKKSSTAQTKYISASFRITTPHRGMRPSHPERVRGGHKKSHHA